MLTSLGGHFKYYYKYQESFRAGNPIHDLLRIESDISTRGEVEKVYSFVGAILSEVKKRISQGELSSEKKLEVIYDVMRDMGIKFKAQDDGSFIHNILNKALDCDTSSFIVIAVAHELGWPVFLVKAPEHVFVRWDDGGGTLFNIDYGNIRGDAFYVGESNISNNSISMGVYLRNLDYKEMLSLFYSNRAGIKIAMGDESEAMVDSNTALDLNPKNEQAYINHGVINARFGNYEEAISDFKEALRLDPNCAGTYSNIGYVKYELKNYKLALYYLNKAIALKPELVAAYANRAMVNLRMRNFKEARDDFQKVSELEPNDYLTKMSALVLTVLPEQFPMNMEPLGTFKESEY